VVIGDDVDVDFVLPTRLPAGFSVQCGDVVLIGDDVVRVGDDVDVDVDFEVDVEVVLRRSSTPLTP